MLFAEPQRSAYDLQFNLAGIPIRVHPLFWIICALPVAQGETQIVDLLLWVVVVFFSIVVHEMGHALAFRHYGWHAHIVLYSFGGLAIPDSSSGRSVQTPQSRMVVALAGPVAGFLLAGVVVLLLYAVGYRVEFQFSFLEFEAGRGEWLTPHSNFNLWLLVDDVLFVNIFWGLVNLLPIYPLDGGRFFREVFSLTSPRDGTRKSLILSIGTAVGMGILAYVEWRSPLTAAMFGYLAYLSYGALQSLGSIGGREE